ncbi:hypothetical protein DRP77_13245, partial [Candidatus Poribacteria bacterium]
GTRGRLWHPGDGSDPPLLIWNEGTSGWSPVPMDDIPEEVRDSIRSHTATACSLGRSRKAPTTRSAAKTP